MDSESYNIQNNKLMRIILKNRIEDRKKDLRMYLLFRNNSLLRQKSIQEYTYRDLQHLYRFRTGRESKLPVEQLRNELFKWELQHYKDNRERIIRILKEIKAIKLEIIELEIAGL